MKKVGSPSIFADFRVARQLGKDIDAYFAEAQLEQQRNHERKVTTP